MRGGLNEKSKEEKGTMFCFLNRKRKCGQDCAAYDGFQAECFIVRYFAAEPAELSEVVAGETLKAPALTVNLNVSDTSPTMAFEVAKAISRALKEAV